MINHLWQSSLFAIAVALLTGAFRKNRAAIRHALWFSASIKFFIPFSLLISLGSHAGWMPIAKSVAAPPISFTMVQIAQPFPTAFPSQSSATSPPVDWAAVAVLSVWACGFAAILLIRSHGWRRIRAAVRSSTPIDIRAGVEVRFSPGLLEPGVVGWFRPLLLLPEGIAERLTPAQLEAVLAHELCHIRRRDNVTAAIHMIVEAVFWFHPLVWWIGARLLEERERACDEAVLSLGSEPREYAAGILNICKSYIESPLSCVSGVTGSNLKKRIQSILNGEAPGTLNVAKKLALAAAGVTVLTAPILVGIISAVHSRAQPHAGIHARFKAASITPCGAFSNPAVANLSPGEFDSGCTTVQRLVQEAYSVPITGGPAWTHSDLYQIHAEADANQSHSTMAGPMMQSLLEDKFKLKTHRETKQVPVYTLTVASGGPQMQPYQGSCIPRESFDYYHPPPPSLRCGNSELTSSGLDLNAASIADLRMFFRVTLDRDVIDETGLTGRFNLHLDLPTEDLRRLAQGPRIASDPPTPATAMPPSFISAVRSELKKLGLSLNPANRPVEFLAIDSILKP